VGGCMDVRHDAALYTSTIFPLSVIYIPPYLALCLTLLLDHLQFTTPQ
jgi:hypothetical protein